jgi:uncharacterized protein
VLWVMGLMSFIELNTKDKQVLLCTAKKSIAYGLQHQCALPIELNSFETHLQTLQASFVTLHLNHQLRGCIGSLEAHQPLIKDVAEHAFSAAFEDPRFPAVSTGEYKQLQIHISVLTPSTPMKFTSEKNLLAQLQPGVDGLILQAGFRKATFLPSVWEQLTDPEDFLNHLKVKAGLKKNAWPEGIHIHRYETINI